MTRETVEMVMKIISNTQKDYLFGRPEVPFQKQVLMTLWFLGNNEVYRSIADRFNVSISTLHLYVYKICEQLISQRKNIIKWPSSHEMGNIMAEFESKGGFPGVVGCIDGTHIRIAKPLKNHESYINRKGFHSLHLQGICNNKKQFIHVICGWPGSVHDARVFNNCEISEDYFVYGSHMIGDSAYPLKNYLMTPYKDNGQLTEQQRLYNSKLSATRIAIEHSFGLLKVRFRILLGTINSYNTSTIPKLILACCILHNLTIDANDSFVCDLTELDDLTDYSAPSLHSESNNPAILIRNYICSTL